MTEKPGAAPALALYYYEACPFCRRVLRVLAELGRSIELRDIWADRRHLRDLIDGGGSRTVPCLRIEYADGRVEWQYESGIICERLRTDLAVA
ncbi:MAG: glutaredoxin family protein [Gammaproteobacteria bacterium]